MPLGPLHRIAFGLLPATAAAALPRLRSLLGLLQCTPVDATLDDE
jgi:hypothetical protein